MAAEGSTRHQALHVLPPPPLHFLIAIPTMEVLFIRPWTEAVFCLNSSQQLNQPLGAALLPGYELNASTPLGHWNSSVGGQTGRHIVLQWAAEGQGNGTAAVPTLCLGIPWLLAKEALFGTSSKWEQSVSLISEHQTWGKKLGKL